MSRAIDAALTFSQKSGLKLIKKLTEMTVPELGDDDFCLSRSHFIYTDKVGARSRNQIHNIQTKSCALYRLSYHALHSNFDIQNSTTNFISTQPFETIQAFPKFDKYGLIYIEKKK